MERAATLERRLANFRAATRARPLDTPWQRAATPDLAERMAVAVDGEVVRTPLGAVVRREPPIRVLPIDRERLARLPGQPPPDAPLVCLDTETTGLATAAGTVAFLVGLGWWEGDGFRQVQLLLPDHAEEPALLASIAERIPPDAWLVTYNGRGFDWPLLVTRFRMARREAPPHAGHLDLLPLVRRLFRHRMADARLRTAEAELLGLRRIGDVDGWQIPGRYLDFLRGGPADPLVEVVRHNDQDVRSLAHLVGHVERGYADPEARSAAPRGDLAGLARAFARERRFDEALECLDAAVSAEDERPPSPHCPRRRSRSRSRRARRRPNGGSPPTGRTSADVRGGRSHCRHTTGRQPSPRPGPRSGCTWTVPTSFAGWAASRTPARRGRPSPRPRGGSGSSRRSSSPSSASTASAIRSGRSRRPPEGWPRPNDGGGSGGRSRSSRRTSCVGSNACGSASRDEAPAGSAERQTRGFSWGSEPPQ